MSARPSIFDLKAIQPLRGHQPRRVDTGVERSETASLGGNLACLIDANAQAGLQPKNSLGCSESR